MSMSVSVDAENTIQWPSETNRNGFVYVSPAITYDSFLKIIRARFVMRTLLFSLSTMLLPILSWTTLAAAQESTLGVPFNGGSQQQFANETINESVNTSTLFASQDIFSTGRFTKHRIDEPDTSYETLRMPFEVALAGKSDRWQPYVYGSGALLRVVSGLTMPAGAVGDDDFSTTRLFAIAGGLGSYLRVSDDFKLSMSCAVTFSHLRNNYDFNNSYSERVLEPDSNLYYNWNMNLFTYAPTVRAIYEAKWGEGTVYAMAAYSQLFNNSVSSSSPAIDIDSSSGILWSRLSYNQPTNTQILDAALGVRPFFQWSNISGKAANGLDLVNLYEMGTDFVFDFKEKVLMFSQMYWGGSYVTGDSFDGYHLGFGGKF